MISNSSTRRCCLLAAVTVAFTLCCAGNGASAKTLTAAFIGAPQAVFDSTAQGCDPHDIPDTRAQAFLDQNHIVHLFATHSIARALVGPNLNEVRRQCAIVYQSPNDPNPADFQDYSWLAGFFTADGRNVAAIMHNEYHGDLVPGMCDTTAKRKDVVCAWDSITYGVSHDGGNTFTQPRPPENLIAAYPRRFAKGTDRPPTGGPIGYMAPTGVVRFGSYYYAMFTAAPHLDQKYGPCLIRTNNPFEPKSWRAWDGSGFNIQFIDPYVATDAVPSQHVCMPVGPHATYAVDSLSYLQSAGVFVATQITPDRRFGEPGIYLNISEDLIHWSPPVLLIDMPAMIAAQGPGKWTVGYVSILDPATTDRDFVVITNTPYLYYVRLDGYRGTWARTLMRRQIRLTVF